MKPLIIYHGPQCKDGWCSAYIAHQYFASKGIDAELHVGVYGQSPPDVTGRDVYILDFSYPRAVLEAMHAKAKSLVVLDHHKTAQKDLNGLPYAHFDMNRSGAKMTWDFFYPGEDAPMMVLYTQDYDLWHKQLPDTDAVNLAMYSYPMTVDAWDALSKTPFEVIVEKGKHMIMMRENYIDQMMDSAQVCQEPWEDGQIQFWKINAPKWSVSDLLDRLCKTPLPDGTMPSFAMAWYEDGQGRHVHSLRSKEVDGVAFDVSTYSKIRGGGGHHQAAGFIVKRGE